MVASSHMGTESNDISARHQTTGHEFRPLLARNSQAFAPSAVKYNFYCTAFAR